MKTILLTIFTLSTYVTFAQNIDTIKVGYKFNMRDLEIGTFKEILYTEFKGKTNPPILKTKSVNKVKINGVSYLEFKHDWVSSKEDFNGGFYYICEPQTLKPVLHIRNTKGKGKEAFKFNSMSITGLDSAQENVMADFNLSLQVPTYNWEIDLETYSLLPMKKGYVAVMNFYHPGGGSPGYYRLEVIDEATISLPNGQNMECWVLFTDYGGTQPAKFYYTKKGQNFIKMESTYNGMNITKVRLL